MLTKHASLVRGTPPSPYPLCLLCPFWPKLTTSTKAFHQSTRSSRISRNINPSRTPPETCPEVFIPTKPSQPRIATSSHVWPPNIHRHGPEPYHSAPRAFLHRRGAPESLPTWSPWRSLHMHRQQFRRALRMVLANVKLSDCQCRVNRT